MRITFTQSGGFVGAVKGCTFDTAVLADDDRRELEALVAASGFAGSSEALSPATRDARHYAIMIEGEEEVLRFVCDDASLPPAARPLVAYLAERARPS